jgi:hypothetical protein
MGPNLHLVKWCGHGNVFQQAKADENMECSMYLCAKAIDFASFYDFSIGFWNCFDSVVFCGHFISLYKIFVLNSIPSLSEVVWSWKCFSTG